MTLTIISITEWPAILKDLPVLSAIHWEKDGTAVLLQQQTKEDRAGRHYSEICAREKEANLSPPFAFVASLTITARSIERSSLRFSTQVRHSLNIQHGKVPQQSRSTLAPIKMISKCAVIMFFVTACLCRVWRSEPVCSFFCQTKKTNKLFLRICESWDIWDITVLQKTTAMRTKNYRIQIVWPSKGLVFVGTPHRHRRVFIGPKMCSGCRYQIRQ